jgi:hypothetical protein
VAGRDASTGQGGQNGGVAGRDAANYAMHGLRIWSEVPLAGFSGEGWDHDLIVRWGRCALVPDDVPPGRVIADRRSTGRRWYVAVDDGERYLLRVPGHCDFIVDPTLRAVECRPAPGVDRRMVGLLVGGLVLAFLLGLAGECALHASAVALDRGAMAFAGDTGMGKSTLAALLCVHGARLVTDDLLRLACAAGVRCIGGVPQLRLRRAAADLLTQLPDSSRVTTTVDDRLAVSPPGSRHTDHPLAVIVLPRPSRDVPTVRLNRVRGAAAVTKLLALSRLAGWTDRQILGRQLDALARLADQVPVVEADIPWGPPFRADVVTDLLTETAFA